MNNVNIVDTLDAGLPLSIAPVLPSPAAWTSSLGAINAANFCNDPTNPVIGAGGSTATWDFGNLTNGGTGNGDTARITIVYTAVVLNTTGNVRGQDRNNSAELGWIIRQAGG